MQGVAGPAPIAMQLPHHVVSHFYDAVAALRETHRTTKPGAPLAVMCSVVSNYGLLKSRSLRERIENRKDCCADLMVAMGVTELQKQVRIFGRLSYRAEWRCVGSKARGYGPLQSRRVLGRRLF